MITTDGNLSDLMRVAESVPVSVHGIVIPVHTVLAQSGCEPVILAHPWETSTRKCERNLDHGRYKITISAVDGSEQVTFNLVATFTGDKRDTLATTLVSV